MEFMKCEACGGDVGVCGGYHVEMPKPAVPEVKVEVKDVEPEVIIVEPMEPVVPEKAPEVVEVVDTTVKEEVVLKSPKKK